MGSVLQFDVSLMERLWLHVQSPRMHKTMLNVQYRSPAELMMFPSKEFYNNQLQSGLTNTDAILSLLSMSSFPWPRRGTSLVPTVFVQCSTEEDMGGMSKSNAGQVEVVAHIIPMLTTPKEGHPAEPEGAPSLAHLKITVLTPYRKQIQALRSKLAGSISCSTVDAFQGRESDIIIFSAVRSNAEGDIGFLEDERRLNVMWTRARLALIIVGDRRTMNTSVRWKRALDSCSEVTIDLPNSDA
ncbi:hypothetical protein C0989_002857 [Termitomyces sp. Mn162]|nr:hypothetical protein C0989_002857 [Termitomyces sp. Mn162]